MPAKIIVDLGYGDSGKGTMVDYFCMTEKVDWVVRYNGGAQCGHNVVLPSGLHHEFHQFGSGSLIGVYTYLSEYMVLNPIFLFVESHELHEKLPDWDPLAHIYVHEDALITTPFHIAANRMREIARGDNKHGSVGLGIGETRSDALSGMKITVGDTRDKDALWVKLRLFQHIKRLEITHMLPQLPMDPQVLEAVDVCFNKQEVDETTEFFHGLKDRIEIVDKPPFSAKENVVFEGAQGVLLDEYHGQEPYRTWTNTLTDNAERICQQAKIRDFQKIGVIRSFMTRHGRGPFLTESPQLTKSAPLQDPRNKFNRWQEEFRLGWLNLNEIRDSIKWTGGIDSLAVTHMDLIQFRAIWRAWTRNHFETYHAHPEALLDLLHEELEISIGYTSYGPTYKDKESLLELP